jgi:hypothetical protein
LGRVARVVVAAGGQRGVFERGPRAPCLASSRRTKGWARTIGRRCSRSVHLTPFCPGRDSPTPHLVWRKITCAAGDHDNGLSEQFRFALTGNRSGSASHNFSDG